jgi:asparaginyl-tRNA synthetase
MKLCLLDETYITLLNRTITVNGWIMSVRSQKEVSFIKINDGTNTKGIQLIINSDHPILSKLSIGTSIHANGTLITSPSPQQPYEMTVKEISIYGTTDPSYPLSKGRLPLDYLRKHAHLRFRTSSFGSIFRIKSAISHATHSYFQKIGFLHINPNILTINECEGGAGVFHVSEHSLSNHKELPEKKDSQDHDWDRDHFGNPTFLTVSSQLQLEAIACSLGSVYTTNKSFRSEHSNTHKHLSEFEHLEIEDVFTTLDDLMTVGENYIRYVGQYLLDHCLEDIENLGKFVSKGLRERIETIVLYSTFYRITYDEAIELLKNAQPFLTKEVVYGEDLCSEFENYLVETLKGPVFVYNWPSSIKSFYMKQLGKENGVDKCSNFDLLMPYHVGELIGGSMREDNLEVMLEVMKEKGVSPDPLTFYTDLRKYGTVPHGGFGLGLDRLCMMFTGMENIKDVVAFPVYYKNCDY